MHSAYHICILEHLCSAVVGAGWSICGMQLTHGVAVLS